MERRLTRDTRRAVLGGVAAGFANYFGVDPVLARIVFIALTALSGAGLVAYVVGWIIMPRDDHDADAARHARAPDRSAAGAEHGTRGGTGGEVSAVDRIVDKVRATGDRLADEFQRLPADAGRGRVVAGSILIVLGALFLLDRLAFWHWPHWARLANLWPLILIVVGASLILEAARGRRGGGS
jgi:phage shock protein C